MSKYEDEVDYSEDPLEGVDIWGLDSHGEVDEMSNSDPVPGEAMPNLSALSNVEGSNTPMGEHAQYSFATPSNVDIGLWDFSLADHDTLASVENEISVHFS